MEGAAEPRVHVVGAAGRLGAALCRRLDGAGIAVVAVVRSAARWQALGLAGTAVEADLANPLSMRRALAGASRIVAVSHAVWTPALMDAAPAAARLVLTGTARCLYSALADPAADAARAAAAALAGRDGAILHPTMIYGSADDGTVGRLAALVRRWPLLPLPGARRLVQPVHVADVAAALMAAVRRAWPVAGSIGVAGPDPLPYAALVRAVAAAAGLPRPIILPVPDALARMAARRRPELGHMLEDRTLDIGPLHDLLGVVPRPLEAGLQAMFATCVRDRVLRDREHFGGPTGV